jgi:hypothetical protein
MRTLLIAIAGLLVGAAGASADVICVQIPGGPPGEEDCVINNGLAPPNPENVIDDSTYLDDWIIVRNVGCPPVWPAQPPEGTAWSPCPSPGGPTEVEVGVDGRLAHVSALDSSLVTIDGEVSRDVLVYDSAGVTMNSGIVEQSLLAFDTSTITINDLGVVKGNLLARGSSTVTMNGLVFKGVWGGLSTLGSSTLTMNSGYLGSLSTRESSAVTMNGGQVSRTAEVTDSATFTMSGGTLSIGGRAFGSSMLTISGGTVNLLLEAFDSSTIEMTGGTLGDYGTGSGYLAAWDSSVVAIEGTNFAVDTGSGPETVPDGDLSAQSGTLTGTLTSGDPIDYRFHQGGWTESPCSVEVPCSGTITLVPEPTQMLLCGCALAVLAVLRRQAA